MSFNRKSLATLIAESQSDFEARLPGADARLRFNVLNVLADVKASGEHMMLGKLSWVARQINAQTADLEFLLLKASLHLDDVPLAATFATGDIVCTGTNGSVIAIGSEFQTSASTVYETTAEGTIAAGTATIPVTAIVAGAAGNLIAGTVLTAITPITGVNSQATVDAGGITGGTEQESQLQILARLLTALRYPRPVGSVGYYKLLALSAHPAVTRVWVFPQELGANTVVIRIVTDNEESLTATAPVIAAVQAYITDESRLPQNAIVTVTSPTEVPTDFTIAITPDTAAVRAAAEAELRDLYLRVAKPQGIIPLSQLNEAISAAAGETDHVMTVPAGNVEEGTNEIPVVGAFTWA